MLPTRQEMPRERQRGVKIDGCKRADPMRRFMFKPLFFVAQYTANSDMHVQEMTYPMNHSDSFDKLRVVHLINLS
jgi:hypothetical protein